MPRTTWPISQPECATSAMSTSAWPFSRGRQGDTTCRIAIATGDGVEEITRVAFLVGDEGRRRAALSAAAALWQCLGPAPKSRKS